MQSEKDLWTKEELKIYILLLCAKADGQEDKEEINLIRSKTNTATFDKIYKEFCEDSEDESLFKIQDIVGMHDYTNMEISQIKKEMHEVFFSDKKFIMMEQKMEKILENIIY